MTYNPKLVKQIIGKQVAELFDGTIKINPVIDSISISYRNLKVGDVLEFKLKEVENLSLRQFIVIGNN